MFLLYFLYTTASLCIAAVCVRVIINLMRSVITMQNGRVAVARHATWRWHHDKDTTGNTNMANEDLTLQDVRKMAADVGMTHLNEEHLQELLRSTRAARARRAALATGALTYADEPSHVFSLTGGASS